jgi:GNAT superfamily N-acetyltransferase
MRDINIGNLSYACREKQKQEMTDKSKDIIRLEMHQLGQAAQVLGRAFQGDEGFEYIVPDEIRRTRLVPSFLGRVIRYCLLYGEVCTTPTLEGVACWLPPGNTRPTYTRMLRTGLLTESLKFGWAGFLKLMYIENYLEKIHRHSVPGPHWYLWWLGVEPTHQGQSTGGALMQPVLERAEAEGLPCYLETDNEANVLFYEKHGFRVVSVDEVLKHRLRFWAMVRVVGCNSMST